MKISKAYFQRLVEEETKKVLKLKKEEQLLKKQLQEDTQRDGVWMNNVAAEEYDGMDAVDKRTMRGILRNKHMEDSRYAPDDPAHFEANIAAEVPAPAPVAPVVPPSAPAVAPTAEPVAQAPVAKPKARPAAKPRAAYNAQDNQVTMQIQQALGIKADGIYGPQTTKAVKQHFASKGQPVPTGRTFSEAIAAQLAAIGGKSGTTQGTTGTTGGTTEQGGIKPVDDRTAIQKAGELADDLDEMYVTDSQLQSAVNKLQQMEKEFGPSGVFKIASKYEGASGTAGADGLTALGNEIDDIDDWMGGSTKTLKALAKDILTKANAWTSGGTDPGAAPAKQVAPTAPVAPAPAAAAAPKVQAENKIMFNLNGIKFVIKESYFQKIIKEELRNTLKI